MATTTLYVNADGSGDFKTINAALESIKANTGDADVTYELVLNGTFNEAVILDSYTAGNGWASDKNITFKKAEDATAVITGRVQIGYAGGAGNKGDQYAWNGDVAFEGVTFDFSEATENTNRFEIRQFGKANELTIKDCVFEGPGVIDADYNGGQPNNNNGDPNGDNAGNLLCTPWAAATDGYQGKLTVTGTSFNNGNVNFWRKSNDSDWTFTDCEFFNAPVSIQGNQSVGGTLYKFEGCRFDIEINEALVGFDAFGIRVDENGGNVALNKCEFGFDNPENLEAAEGVRWTYIWTQQPNGANNNGGTIEIADSQITAGANVDNVDVFTTIDYAETTNQDVEVTGKQPTLDIFGVTAEGTDLAEELAGKDNITINGYADDTTGGSMVSGVIATDGKGGVDVEVGAIENLFVIPVDDGTDPDYLDNLPAGAEVGVNAFTSFADAFKRAFGGSTITFVAGCAGAEAGAVVYEREGILTLTGDASGYVLPQIIFANENAKIIVNFDEIDAYTLGLAAGQNAEINITDSANFLNNGNLAVVNNGQVNVADSTAIFAGNINVFGGVDVVDSADLTSEDHAIEDEDTALVTNSNINVFHNGEIFVGNTGYLNALGNLNINSYNVNDKELVAAIEGSKNDGEAGASVTIDNALMDIGGANVGTVAAAALNVQNDSEVEIDWNVLLGAYGEINVSDSEFTIWNDTYYALFTNAGAFAAEDSVVTVDDMTLKAMIKIDDLVESAVQRDITVVFLRKGDAEGISKTLSVAAGATSISTYVDYLIDGEYELTITDPAREALGKDAGYKIDQFDVKNGTAVLNGGDYDFHSIAVNKGSVTVFGETTLTIAALSGLITVNDGTVLYDTNVAGGQIAFTGDVVFKNDDPQFADEEKEEVILDNNFINDAWIAGENAEVTVNADVYLNARYMIVGGTDAKGDLANYFGGYTNANGGTLTVEGAMFAEQITVHADGLVNVEGYLHAPCLFVWNKTAAVNVAEDGVLRTVFFSLKEGSATIAGEAQVIGAVGEHKTDILSIADGATLTIDGGSVVTNRGILVGFGSAMNIDGGSLVYANVHDEADFDNYAVTNKGTINVTGESTIVAGFDGEGKLIFDDATITEDSVIDAAADGEVRFIGNSTIANGADVDFAGLVFAGTMEGKAEADDFVGEASNLTINADADFGSLFIGSQYKAGVPADGSKAVVTVAGTVVEDPTTGAEVTDAAIVTIDGVNSGLVIRNSGILNIEEDGFVFVGADKQTIVQGEMNVAGAFTNTHEYDEDAEDDEEKIKPINNAGPFSVYKGGKVTVKDGGIVAIGKYEYANDDWSGIPRIGLDDEEESVEFQSGAVVVEGNGKFSAFGNLTVNTYGSVTVEADGLFRVAETILNAGTITVDAAGQIGLGALAEDSNAIVIDAEGFTGFNKVIDIFGGTAETETADYIIVNGFEGLREVVINGDLYLTTLDTNILYVNSTFAVNNPAIGDEVAEDIYYGVNGFEGLHEIMHNGPFAEEDVVVNIQNTIDETGITDDDDCDKVGNITLVNASGNKAVNVRGGYDFGRTDYTTLTIGETVKVTGASLKNINGYTVINGEANFIAVTAESVAEEGEELIVTDIKVNKTGVLTAGTIDLDAANLIVAGELTADDVFAEDFEEPAQLTARAIDAEDAVISLTNTVAAIGTAKIDEESILAINGSVVVGTPDVVLATTDVVVAKTDIDNDGTVAIADNSVVYADFTGAGTIEVAGKVSLIGNVTEDVDVDFNGATLTDADLTVNAGDVTFGDLNEEIANTINGGAASFANVKVYGDLTIAEEADVTFSSMADTVYGDIVITGEDSELTIKEKVVVAGDITIADNGTLTVESMMSLGEYNEYTLTNGNLNLVGAAGVISGAKSTITMDYASTIAFANSAITIGTLTVDLSDYTEGTYKLFDYTGAGNLAEDYYDELVAEWNDNFVVVDNDLYLTDAPADVLYVAYTADEAVKADLIYNWNAFNTFENAVKQIANVKDDVVINVTKDLDISIADSVTAGGATADYDYVINGVDYLNDKEELTTVKLTGRTYFNTANADGIDVTITNADVNSEMILVGKGVTLEIANTTAFDVTDLWIADGEFSFELGNVIEVDTLYKRGAGKISVDLRSYDAEYDAFAVNEEGEIVNKDMIGVYKVIESAATTYDEYVALFGKNWNTGYFVEDGALWFDQERGTVTVESVAELSEQLNNADNSEKAALMIVEKGKYTENISFNEIETLVKGGTFEGTVSGGNIYDEDADVEGYTDTEIAGGTYNKVVMGADRVNEGNVVREGDSTLTITGGEFNSQVVGGMAYIGNGSEPLKEGAFLEGDVELTIAGGEFNSWVYGGSIASNAALSTQAVIDGDVTITVDTTDNAVVFGEDSVLVAGSYKSGPITGDTNIVFTGKGENLTLDGNTVWGGNSADVYVNTAAGREFRTEIEGDRIVSFEAFAGDFGGNIRGFDTFEVVDGSDVNVLAGNLTDIEVWNFDTESSLSGAFANSFAGDELNVEISGDVAAEGWEIYAGSIAGFEDLDKVTIGGEEAAWDSAMAAFATDSFKLEVEGNSLKISALA